MTSRDNPVRRQLETLYDVLSHKIAGGQRVDHRALLPGSDDPLEGLVPDDFRDELTPMDWYSPSDWAGLGAEDALRVDLANIQPATGGRDGKGMDFFRGGEAPDNYTNRHNPLYKARAEFVTQVTPKLNEMFGVQGHAGFYRQPHPSHAAPGGPSSNSDHYSAGAVDFYGTPEELDALRDYLVGQPWVSFVRWRSESHYDHLHASFDLGWVAQNYFSGREAPSLPRASTQPPPSAPAPREASPEPTQNTVLTGGPR